MHVQLSVAGAERTEGLEQLATWLSNEPELRGRVQPVTAVPASGELGSAVDALVVAVGAGGTASVLAASLKVFLSQPRRSDLHITVRTPDGKQVELDASRIDDVEAVVRQVLGQPE